MVKWSEIDAKCDVVEGGYRQQLVAIFKECEGEETDEVVRGKPVFVTVTSFARHRNIARKTFADWVEKFSPGGIRLANNPECVNKDVPAREGFVREVNARLRECLPLLPYLSADTLRLVAEDLIETKALLAEIEALMKARTA